MKSSQRKAVHAKRKLARLSDLAKIPRSILEKEHEKATGADKRKLQQAMNLRIMRGLSNKPNGMFGMRDY